MSMSKPKWRAPPAKNPKLDKEEEKPTPKTEKTMDDLPPEVLTIILEHAILNQRKNNMLVFRLVNSQWKDIVDSLLEKEVISGRLEVFPAMEFRGQPDQLSVCCPKTVFRAGENPLSFNCLLLNGNEYFHQGPADSQMALPIFMSRFGANLTFFALHDHIISTTSLATMLRSMSNLKVLCLKKVELSKRSIGPGGILQPPPLPSLTTLELKSKSFYGENDDKRNTLYVWLIVSYADQLVSLNLETSNQLPALQNGHEYSIPGCEGEMFSIATTSHSAFKKLKELKVYSPSPEFLQSTQTPALQRLSITSWHEVDLRDIKKIIGRCGSSLEEVSLVVLWKPFDKREGILEVVAENVKKLTLFFSEDEEVTFDKATLSMFPALEVIQLLGYNSQHLDDELALYYIRSQDGSLAVSEANGSNHADEANSLKQRLKPLGEQKAALVRRFRGEAQLFEDILMVEYKRAPILRQLAALGENMNQVNVEQMLERNGVWNTCPNLKIFSVSWDEEPVGDVCRICRTNEA